MSSKHNPLATLIGNYDSDGTSEEETKSSPSKAISSSKLHRNSVTHPPPIPHCPWSACYDEESGYTYYWNHKTNEVTWQPPKEYLLALKIAAQIQATGKNSVTAEEWQTYKQTLLERDIKSSKDKYNTHESSKSVSSNISNKLSHKPVKRKPPNSDSEEDVKIEPIKFYDKSDTDSNDEQDSFDKKRQTVAKEVKKPPMKKEMEPIKKVVLKKKKTKKSEVIEYGPSLPPNQEYMVPIGPELPKELICDSKQKSNSPKLQQNEDSQDEENLMKQIKAKAKILKNLGGELPTELNELIESPKPEKMSQDVDDFLAQIESEIKQPKPLFPSVKNIQDNTKKIVESKVNILPNVDDSLVNKKKKLDMVEKPKTETPSYTTKYSQEDFRGNKTGLGFSNGDTTSPTECKQMNYIGFTKGETLNDAKVNDDGEMKSEAELLEAKLKFLNEQLPIMSPVQEMSVQLQTLNLARKAGALALDYWRRFIEVASSSLVELESKAAPHGWTTYFQREAGRYLYKRTSDGHEQWDYPFEEAAITDNKMAVEENKMAAAVDNNMASDDMDLCTTPPPPSITESSWPRSPSPPPPPRITPQVAPPLPPSPPPGVESPPHLSAVSTAPAAPTHKADNADDLLQSFYSDIASLETKEPPKTTSIVMQPMIVAKPASLAPPEERKEPSANLPGKIKKKSKVKLTGIKNKNVSSMVAKWQQVQEEIESD